MPSKDIRLADKSLNGVHRLRFTIEEDGTAWTGIDSVLLTFEKPDRSTQFTRNATLESDPDGIWYYQTSSADLDEAGNWTLSVQITDGAIVVKYPYEIGFRVKDNP